MAFQEYPRHVHKAGGEFLVVEDDAQKTAAVAEGWALQPVLCAPLASTEIEPVKRGPGRPKKLP